MPSPPPIKMVNKKEAALSSSPEDKSGGQGSPSAKGVAQELSRDEVSLCGHNPSIKEQDDLVAKICRAESQSIVDRKESAWKMSVLREKNQRLREDLSIHQELMGLVIEADKKIDQYVERRRVKTKTHLQESAPRARVMVAATATLPDGHHMLGMRMPKSLSVEGGQGRSAFASAMEEFDRMHDKNLEMQGTLLEMTNQHTKNVLEIINNNKTSIPFEQTDESIYMVLEDDFEL